MNDRSPGQVDNADTPHDYSRIFELGVFDTEINKAQASKEFPLVLIFGDENIPLPKAFFADLLPADFFPALLNDLMSDPTSDRLAWYEDWDEPFAKINKILATRLREVTGRPTESMWLSEVIISIDKAGNEQALWWFFALGLDPDALCEVAFHWGELDNVFWVFITCAQAGADFNRIEDPYPLRIRGLIDHHKKNPRSLLFTDNSYKELIRKTDMQEPVARLPFYPLPLSHLKSLDGEGGDEECRLFEPYIIDLNRTDSEGSCFQVGSTFIMPRLNKMICGFGTLYKCLILEKPTKCPHSQWVYRYSMHDYFFNYLVMVIDEIYFPIYPLPVACGETRSFTELKRNYTDMMNRNSTDKRNPWSACLSTIEKHGNTIYLNLNAYETDESFLEQLFYQNRDETGYHLVYENYDRGWGNSWGELCNIDVSNDDLERYLHYVSS